MAIAVEGTTASLYLNGVLADTKTLAVELPVLADALNVGADNRTEDPRMFVGTIYSINLFDDVRTAEEIKTDAIAVASNTEGLIYSNYFQD